MRELVGQDCRFVIATHSPILITYPGAAVYELTDGGIEAVAFDQTENYQLFASFLASPDRFLRRLLSDGP
ncbi:MAG: hypothetical protein ACR2MA_00050 [Egibacteraceae bacterium]